MIDQSSKSNLVKTAEFLADVLGCHSLTLAQRKYAYILNPKKKSAFNRFLATIYWYLAEDTLQQYFLENTLGLLVLVSEQ